MPSSSAGRSFFTSGAIWDVRKPCSRQISRRTAASVSAKVGLFLRYQAAVATTRRAWRLSRAARSVTRENSPSKQGVVRAMARSDHWRWVSTPRWSRTSRKVTSTCQRWTNQVRICNGSRVRSVQSRACGSKRPWGSRRSTQRIGTVGRPAWCQTAVEEGGLWAEGAGGAGEDPPGGRRGGPHRWVQRGGGGGGPGGAPAPAIPTRHRDALPLRSRVDQRRGEARQALALGPGPPARPGLAGRGWFVEGSIEAQARDTGYAVAGQRRQEFQGRKGAVADQHQLPPGQPAAGLQCHLPRPVRECLVSPPALPTATLRGRERGQERQRPHPSCPRDRRQEHQAQPAQAAGLDEKRLRRTHRVTVDALGRDTLAAAALDRVVQAQHHRPRGHEGGNQQP